MYENYLKKKVLLVRTLPKGLYILQIFIFFIYQEVKNAVFSFGNADANGCLIDIHLQYDVNDKI